MLLVHVKWSLDVRVVICWLVYSSMRSRLEPRCRSGACCAIEFDPDLALSGWLLSNPYTLHCGSQVTTQRVYKRTEPDARREQRAWRVDKGAANAVDDRPPCPTLGTLRAPRSCVRGKSMTEW